MTFLRSGGFTSVASGAQFYDGGVMSLFLPDTTSDDTLFGVEDGKIFQSPMREFIYESGVVLDGTNVTAPPTVMSGVYVEGAFRPTTDSEFGHTIDFINGRIIFDTAQSLDLQVHADFAYREVRVGFEHNFNQQYRQGYLESKYTTNPGTSNQLVYPSGQAYPFPAVFIEVDERKTRGYELGNRSLIMTDSVKMHIWALNDMQRDNIFDIITAQVRKQLPLIDFNMAPLPLSGIYNTLSNEYIPYQLLLRNNEAITTVGSGSPVKQIVAFEHLAEGRNLPATEEFERALVTFNVDAYLNAPNQPLGFVLSAISDIPRIQVPPF